MPLPTFNFMHQNQPHIPHDWSNLANLFQNYWKGYEQSHTPYALADEEQKRALGNQYQGLVNQYYGPKAEADIAATRAGTNLTGLQAQQLQAKLPFASDLARAELERAMMDAQTGGLTGNAANAIRLERMKNVLGEDNPLYQAARQQYDLDVNTRQLQNRLNEGYLDTMAKRYATTYGKKVLEQRDVEQGFLPGTMESEKPWPITPQQQNQLIGHYENQRLIESSDTPTRQKSIFATNIDKSLNMIDIDKLTRYSGLAGNVAKKIDQGLQLSGQESKEYEEFTNELVKAQVLASQIRAFYGDSVSPSVAEKLEHLTNPSSITKSPQTAKRNFESLKKLLEAETATYRNILGAPKEYFGGAQGAANKPTNAMTNEELLEALKNAK